MALPPLSATRATSLRWAAVAVAVAVLGAGLTAGVARWTLPGPGMAQAVARQVETGTGLKVAAIGQASVRLLPRPVLELHGGSFHTPDGAVRIDAERLRGTLDIGALATGEVRLSRVWLDRPTVSVDVDRVAADIGPMLRGAPGRLAGLLRTRGLTLRDGVVQLHSAAPAADLLLTDVSATFAWPSEGAGASLSGSATWRGTDLAASLDLDGPDALLAGGESLASLHLRSEPLDLQLIATLSAAGERRAVGRITAATGDLAAFLRLIDYPAPQLGGFSRARLDGRMAAAGDALSISDATIGLDDMQFEGALAVRRKDDRPALAATLATERIDLGRFLGMLPGATGPDGAWSGRALDTRAIADDEIDLRVSAARATLGPFDIDDSSLSLQSGEGRLELSLGEARAYDGLVKARVVASLEGGTTVARLDAALSRLDLGKLLADAGTAPVGGILTGRIGVEARGSSPAALARTAQGRGEVTLHDGALDPAALAALTHDAPAAAATDLLATFDEAALHFGIRRGEAKLDDGWVSWPKARAALSGSASLPDQRLDLKGVLSPAPEGDGPVAFGLAGLWRDLRLAPARLAAAPRPPS